jgi:hypothetical protein
MTITLTESAAWDDRARADEEHPPFGTCRRLTEEGPFAEDAGEVSK